MPAITYGFENVQSLIGIAVILFICWLLSENKKRFPFRLMVGAIAMQAVLVLLLFAVPQSKVVLEGIGGGIEAVSNATAKGMQFVFGYMGGGAQPYQVINPNALFVFALQVLPLILVISALGALLWHWGILKLIIRGFGLIFEKLIGLGGASALGVSSGIFLGNVESMILIRGYLDKLTRSELFLMIVIGMANVSGSTMVAYVMMLSPVLPHAAGHILAASIVSAPAGVLLARIMLPEAHDYKHEKVDYSSALKYDSAMDAITKGTTEGMNVVIGIATILVVMVALVALGNSILSVVPSWDNQPVTIERVLGILLSPLAWLMGVPWKEAQTGGYLLGVKMVLTEFVAYLDLAKVPVDAMSPRTRIILTYALCGFANIASVGISIAGYSALIPERRGEIIDMVWKGFLAAFLTTCLSAAVVGALPNAVYGL